MNEIDLKTILDDLVEVKLLVDFLVIKETLTRIGIASSHSKRLFQSCHILKKRGTYYILSFKELFKLDGKRTDFTTEDRARRNAIIQKLSNWNFVEVLKPEQIKDPIMTLDSVTTIRYDEKESWELIPKYKIGKK